MKEGCCTWSGFRCLRSVGTEQKALHHRIWVCLWRGGNEGVSFRLHYAATPSSDAPTSHSSQQERLKSLISNILQTLICINYRYIVTPRNHTRKLNGFHHHIFERRRRFCYRTRLGSSSDVNLYPWKVLVI